ncbi:MAG TPA: clostripain-related cysteine peptidase, partial [Bdellovibrionota bacterium]|nr:clostripain-related cysteine peptidase [Bdellovibrionota bacterium]
FSAYDLSKISALYSAVRNLGTQFSHLSSTDRRKVVTAANGTQTFTYADYGDLMDFLGLVQKAGITTISADVYKAVTDAVAQFVVANQTTSSYAKAKGLSIWLPHSMSDYNSYGSRYAGLNLNKQTAWGSTLQALLK